MKLLYKSLFILPLAITGVLSSCIDDESVYGGAAIPSISVMGSDSDKPYEMNFNYGEDCVIDPQVRYDGTGTLSYSWSVATYANGVRGKLSEVSTEPVFSYFFPEGGTYIVQLNATDGIIGIVQEYQINMNRTFEQGYALVSNDANGEGNLVFIKSLTAEDIEAGISSIIIEHSLETINKDMPSEEIMGIFKLLLTYPNPVTRIAVVTTGHAYFLDPNTFMAITTVDYNKLIPGFKASIAWGSSAAISIYDQSLKRFITVNATNMFGYESTALAGYEPDEVIEGGSYEAWGTLTFVNYLLLKNPMRFYAQYVSMDDWLSKWNYSSDLRTDDGHPLFENEELVKAFMGVKIPGPYADIYPDYVITRDVNTGKYYNSYIDALAGGSYYPMALLSRAEIDVDASTAVPTHESRIVPSHNYSRTYYSVGSNVYVALLLSDGAFSFPSTAEACLSYPGEEVTALYVRDSKSNDGSDQLCVATVNQSTGRGNFYIYTVADVRTDNPNPAPVYSYKDCADRIVKIFYKPRI